MTEAPIKPKVVYLNNGVKKSEVVRPAISQALKYNPDADYQLPYMPFSETVLGRQVEDFSKLFKEGKARVDAKLLITNREGETEMLHLKEATATNIKEKCEQGIAKLKESMKEDSGDFFTMGGTVPTLGMEVTQEYLPLMGGPFYKQLYLYDYLDMHRKCFEAVNHNPVARNIVHLMTNFTLGRGVVGTCKSDAIQLEWDRFYKKNKIGQRIKQACNDLSIYGEVMIRCIDNPLTGTLFIREIDPSTVWEIVTAPDDIESVYYYHQQYPTAYQIYTPPEIPITEYIIRQIPASEMIHKKINVVSNEKRGRSDLFPVLGWLKRLKDYFTAKVIKAQIENNFVQKIKLKGNDADVSSFKSYLENTGLPNPGGVWIENEAFELEYMQATTSSNAQDEVGSMLLTMIATGVGIPKEYLGLGDRGTRATALVASEPSVKKFQDRQAVIEELLIEIYDRWLKGQMAQGKFTDVQEDDREIEFSFPEIAIEDRTAKLKDLALAESMEWISKQTAGAIAGKELSITTYDYDYEQEQVKLEKQKAIATAFANQPKVVDGEDITGNAGEEPDKENPGKKDNIDSGAGKVSAKSELRKL